MVQNSRRGAQKRNRIFISWSGANSKEFAKGLKETLEKRVFSNCDCECFVSDQDYAVATQKGSNLSQSVADTIQAMLDDGTIATLIDKWD